ncbi:MAG: dynamin family protein [Selenomonadaceae bacterium]|nr:dynamin family protein [Selenomonadaceae bacterium]
MKPFTKILPQFKDVKLVTNRDNYEEIYQSEQQSHSAWLLDETELIWEFIEELAEADDKSSHDKPLNLYDFYIAYNLKFSSDVSLLNKSKVLQSGLKDFSELLNAVIRAGNGELNILVTSDKLKLKILQQFIYLRIFLPVIVDGQTHNQAAGEVGIFGTKKAGKSALINALLGNEYAVSSPMLPTPNKVTYSAANKDAKEISLTYKNSAQNFHTVNDLQKFLTEKNSLANKNSETLDEMTIALPDFPAFLNGARLIDTPGSNFAAGKGHADIIQKTLVEVPNAVFVMNYSQYLTQDELKLFDEIYKQFNNAKVKRPILIALNRVDEIFDSEESKSYERVADYIHYRLTALGYENFLVIGVSVIQAVYFDEITRLIEPPATFFERMINYFKKFFVKPVPLDEQLKKLKTDLRGTDKVSVVVFVRNILTDFEDFHSIVINNVRDLQKINRINYLKCLLHNFIQNR